MEKDNVIDLKNPESFIDDPLTAILRKGARKLMATGIRGQPGAGESAARIRAGFPRRAKPWKSSSGW